MSHTVSGKLFKAPFIKTGCGKDAQSTMFAFKLSEKTKDFKTGADVYANYDAVIYAQSQGQIDFYTQATAEGSFVVVSCDKLSPKISDCGKYVNLNMENARLENANYDQPNSTAQQATSQTAPQMAPAYQQPPKQTQQANLSETDQGWVNAVRANPSLINQIDDPAYKARIQSLV